MGPGGRMPRGDGRKAKNVGKTLKRILSYVGKEYKFHIIGKTTHKSLTFCTAVPEFHFECRC